MKFITLTSCFLLSIAILFAQKRPVRLGKVTKEELQLSECSFHPDANSMTLVSYGDLHFVYNDSRDRFQLKISVHERIKVFNELDKDVANIALRYYDPVDGASREVISNIKGFTYNLIDGKVKKTKLTNSEEYTTRLSDYRSEVSFAMPDVRDGSVFEYAYDITSDFYGNLYEWHFQKEIPVAHSEFRYTIPEFYNYQSNQLGSYVVLKQNEETKTESFTYSWERQGAGGAIERGKSTLPSISKKHNAIAKNIKPIEDEPYMTNRPDIPARLEFQLISTKFPGQVRKLMAEDYEQFTKTLMESSTLGKTMKKGSFAKDKIATLSDDQDVKAEELYIWLRDHFVHDGSIGFSSQKAGKFAFNEGSGSVADINLTLVAAMQEAELQANPVILSTRGSGTPHPIYPNTEDFNYVIGAVETSSGIVLFDATGSLPFGVLPKKCLNSNGWLLGEAGGKWVKLKSKAEYGSTTLVTYSHSAGEMNVDYAVKYTGYAAIQESAKVKDDETKYEENLASIFPEAELSDTELNTDENDMIVKFHTTKSIDGDILYIQPIQYGSELENPFKREERMSLVDFPYGISESVIIKIDIPDGYTAEMPEQMNVSLPNNGGRFLYTATVMGGQVNIMSAFQLKQTEFTPQDYPILKQFFDIATNKNKEMVVLKKL